MILIKFFASLEIHNIFFFNFNDKLLEILIKRQIEKTVRIRKVSFHEKRFSVNKILKLIGRANTPLKFALISLKRYLLIKIGKLRSFKKELFERKFPLQIKKKNMLTLTKKNKIKTTILF